MFYVETKRLILTPFKTKDAQEYFSIISDEDIKRYVPYSSAYTLKATKEHINTYIHGDFKRDFYICIRLKSSNEIVGAIIAVALSPSVLDVSYFIGKKFRNQGFGFEAFENFIIYLIDNNFKYRLHLTIEDENIYSQKIAKKCGGVRYKRLFNASVYKILLEEDPLELL